MDSLFCCIITLQCGLPREILEAGIETRPTYTPIVDSTVEPLENKRE